MNRVDPSIPPPPQDLGFGTVVARESRQRFLNRDGTFNVRRTGLGFFESWTVYEYLVTLSWPRFLLIISLAYAVTNAVFALAYWLCGPGAIAGSGEATHEVGSYLRAYFFSLQTLATIGYGHLSPRGLTPNIIVGVESLVGLLGLALVTGLAFARFARPVVALRYSERAVMAPYRGGTGFMFRVANAHQSQLVNVEARVMLARKKTAGPSPDREFVLLALERDRIVFFPLAWTIVHPITPESPLYGSTPESLQATDAEFLVLLSAFDEISSQVVHSRSSYKAEEVVFGAKFKTILNREQGGVFHVDVRDLSEIETVMSGE